MKQTLQEQRLSERYSTPAIFFHWILAILIPALIGLGWYMMSVEDDPASGWLFDLHKSLGIAVAMLVVLRIVWRLGHIPALLPKAVPSWQAHAARLGHKVLYLLMVLMPVTGYLGASFSKDGVAFFGIPTPQWASPNHALQEQFFTVHSALAWALVIVIAVHILGALKHLWSDKDGVFQRMWPK